jgi:hypothetical protein
MAITLDGTSGVTTPGITLGSTSITASPAAINSSGEDVNAENRIINGDFGIWQRNTTSTGNGYVAADRWSNNITGGTVTQSRQAFTLGDTLGVTSPSFFLRQSVSGQTLATQYASILQSIEGVRSYAGQTITVLGWARRSSGAGNMVVEMEQYFGLGGSPSPTVNAISPTTVTLGSTWAPFAAVMTVPSIGTKTIGTDGNDRIAVLFWTSAGSNFSARTNSLGLQTIGVDLWGIHIRTGTWTAADAALYRPRDPGTELLLCQRYYEQARGGGVAYAASSGAIQRFFVKYGVTKRALPGAASVTYLSGTASTPAVNNSFIDGAFISFASTGASQDIIVRVDADAEL